MLLGYREQAVGIPPPTQMQMLPPQHQQQALVQPPPQQMAHQPLLPNQQQQVVLMPVPVQIVQPGFQYVLDGHQVLSALTHIVIREKIRMLQVLVGWERPNVYQIEDRNAVEKHPLFSCAALAPRQNENIGPKKYGNIHPNFRAEKIMEKTVFMRKKPTNIVSGSCTTGPLLFAEEKSHCLARQCCPSGVRGWEMNIRVNGGAAGQIPFLHFKKPMACACCCFCRPVLEIYDRSQGQGNYLVGTIENPFVCCNMQYEIKDNTGVAVLRVRGHACQPGMFLKRIS